MTRSRTVGLPGAHLLLVAASGGMGLLELGVLFDQRRVLRDERVVAVDELLVRRYLFWSPEPGVIVYQYRQGRLVPVEVEAPEASSERRWKLELQPLTREQQQAIITTTIGGAMLLMSMFLLSPVGA